MTKPVDKRSSSLIHPFPVIAGQHAQLTREHLDGGIHDVRNGHWRGHEGGQTILSGNFY